MKGINRKTFGLAAGLACCVVLFLIFLFWIIPFDYFVFQESNKLIAFIELGIAFIGMVFISKEILHELGEMEKKEGVMLETNTNAQIN